MMHIHLNKMQRTVSNSVLLLLIIVLSHQILLVSQFAYGAIMDLNNVKLVEYNDSRLVATSNYNYAIMSPQILAKNWRTVSVNGDNVLMITPTNEVISKTRTELTEEDRSFIENLRDNIANGASQGYGYVSSLSGTSSSLGPSGRSMVVSSSNNGASTSSSSSSISSSSTRQESSSGGRLSVNMRDDNNFSVSKSDLPYNWSNVFVNGDLVTFVYRNGEVEMRPLASLEQDRLVAVNQLKKELKDMLQSQERQISSTMQHSVDMVSNVFNNIMGTLPKPPSYKSAVGNMFGDNFPFGPNNSPFSSASGWPFGGGGGSGSGAFAFASRR